MSEERQQPLDNIDALSARDAVRTFVVGVGSAVPVIGPFVGALLDQYIPEQQARRVIRFLGVLHEHMVRLGDRVDREFVRTDEFGALFEEVIERVRSRRSEGKRQFYAAAVANATTQARPSEEERLRMVDVLDALRISHFRLLAMIVTVRLPPVLDPANVLGRIGATRDLDLRISSLAEMSGVPADGLDRDWSDLERLNLVKRHPSAFEVTDDSYRFLRNMSVYLTPFGRAFHDFITAPK